jgi:hypothetical protein
MPTLTKGLAEYAAKGCLVKPILLQWLQDVSLPLDFVLHVERSGNRAPDQWFHPSGHPMLTQKQLLDYLLYPQFIEQEPMSYAGAMGTLFGTMTHELVEAILNKAGLAEPLPEGPCPACGRPRPRRGHTRRQGQCGEHSAVHAETHAKGHLDAILNLQDGPRGFDLKTRWKGGLKGVRDMDPALFAEKWPGYYWQAQEYMRITGLRRYIVLFLEMGMPWEMREFHLDFDPGVALEIECKYRAALAGARSHGLELVA